MKQPTTKSEKEIDSALIHILKRLDDIEKTQAKILSLLQSSVKDMGAAKYLISEGISVDDFFTRLERFKPIDVHTVNDENMTVDEASAFLKLSTPTLHRLKAKNAIPFVKVGARTIYRKSQLLAWMDSKSNQNKVHTNGNCVK